MDINAIMIIFIMAILIVVSFYIISLYNRLSNEKNIINNKFNPIDKEMKNAKNILKEYLEIIEKYEKFEENLFLGTKKLIKIGNLKKINDKTDYLEELIKYLKKFASLDTLYIELKKNKKYQNLNIEYNSIMDRLSYSVAIYNDRLKEYNNLLKKFPYSIIAKVFGFKNIKLLKIKD